LLMTCVTSGTIVYDQLVDLFKPLWPQDRTIDELRDWLAEEAATVPPGCNGVAALPFYGGEGVLRQPNAFAALLGLRKGDLSAGVLARSSMEASSLMMRYGFECMKAEGLAEVSQLVLSGGGSKNALWPQIVADIFKLPVVMPQDADEAATRGAAYLALHMLEQQTPQARSLEALLEERVTLSEPILPRPSYFEVYDEMLPVLIDTAAHLAPLYDHARFIESPN
jgi:sugar (pentulose or hexulose) kinase